MQIVESTRRYERWLGQRLPVIVKRDLRLKHQRMASDPFSLLRGTFYRWAELWPQLCQDLAGAPRVLGVGDLHVENFGTWRDGEGRLIWGINDFDEATTVPYTNDLVRLCTSALLAKGRLGTAARRTCDAVLKGYTDSLRDAGMPVVLAERNRWLRDLALGRLKEQRRYWDKLLALKPPAAQPARRVRLMLQGAIPDRRLPLQIMHRQAGLGSLGRQRFTVLAHWRGGMIAREAKALTTSAWGWLSTGKDLPVQYSQVVSRAVRVADPFLQVHEGWVLRRLAPDCSRIELADLSGVQDECKLLRMMGWETGNVHLGSIARREAILSDLKGRRAGWLCDAARTMRDATIKDWRAWRDR
jgi:uncharacterized protein (DUF2252 family)